MKHNVYSKNVVLVIDMRLFMVLSLWHSHFESSPGLSDECSTNAIPLRCVRCMVTSICSMVEKVLLRWNNVAETSIIVVVHQALRNLLIDGIMSEMNLNDMLKNKTITFDV